MENKENMEETQETVKEETAPSAEETKEQAEASGKKEKKADKKAKAELLKTLNVDKAVSKDTPPAFIWTTVQDSIVPCVNCLHYATALSKAGIEFELHIHPRGDHGAATGKLEINAYYPELANISGWINDCSRFFRMYTVEKM